MTDRSEAEARKAEILTAAEELFGRIDQLPVWMRRDILAEIDERHKVSSLIATTEKYVPPPLPESGQFVPYRPRVDNAYEHLKTHWGLWLKAFNPELDRDYLTQAQLRKRDEVLLNAFYNQLNTHRGRPEFAGKKVKDFIPTSGRTNGGKATSLTESQRAAANWIAVRRRGDATAVPSLPKPAAPSPT